MSKKKEDMLPCSKARCNVTIPTIQGCSLCKRVYCSQACFTTDDKHNGTCLVQGSVIILRGHTQSRKRFEIVAETSEIQLAHAYLEQGDVIEMEQHTGVTQMIRVEDGVGSLEAGGKVDILRKGDTAIIPASTYHEVRADQGTSLKLSTIYAPPTTH